MRYFRHESGNIWAATIHVPGVFPFYQQILLEPAGSRQLPSKNLLDLRFEKEFPIYTGQLHFTVDVFNLFNTAFATDVNDHLNRPSLGSPPPSMLRASPKFALRGTVSNGFRAPGIQQALYSQRSTNLNAAGILTDTLTARQDSSVTRAFGIPALKEETSKNFSFGIVAKPTDVVRLTVDYFHIDINNRIVFSSNIQPEDPSACSTPSGCPIRAILDPLGVGQILFFTNAVDTRTQGLDIVLLYDIHFGRGSLLTLEGAMNFNKTEVTDRHSPSTILPAEVLFDQAQVTLVEEAQPKQHHTFSGTYYRGPWTANLRLNYFGKVAGEGFTPGFKQVWSGKWLTDASIGYEFKNGVSFMFGGLNIFNIYPDKWDPEKAFPFPQLGFVYGWETVPFGINGASYYVRAGYHF